MQCDHVADLLPQIVEGTERAAPPVLSHVESCLRCQAELAQYRKLLRALRHLRTEVLDPMPGTVASILAYMEAAGERGAMRSILAGRRAAYLGGIAVATAGAAGAIVVASRGRRKVRLAG